MQDDTFEWDDEKARTNHLKHGVAFEEARLIFSDPGFVDEPDDTMTYGEERFRALGMANGRLMAVCYILRDDRFRIITAPLANRKEHRDYARQNPPT